MTSENELTPKKKKKKNPFKELLMTLVYALLVAAGIRSLAFEPFYIPSVSMTPTLLVGDYLLVSKYSYGYSKYSFPFGLAPFGGRVFASMPERGDIVVFRPPKIPDQDYIKRVIGLPGDTIEMRHGRLYINNKIVPREYLDTYSYIGADGQEYTRKLYRETLPGSNGNDDVVHPILEQHDYFRNNQDNMKPVKVPEGYYFMMGDNRDDSKDSRIGGDIFAQAPGVVVPDMQGEVHGFVPFEYLIGRAEVLWFSSTEDGNLFLPWTWGDKIRFERFFQELN
jgi:signal peptidase I